MLLLQHPSTVRIVLQPLPQDHWGKVHSDMSSHNPLCSLLFSLPEPARHWSFPHLTYRIRNQGSTTTAMSLFPRVRRNRKFTNSPQHCRSQCIYTHCHLTASAQGSEDLPSIWRHLLTLLHNSNKHDYFILLGHLTSLYNNIWVLHTDLLAPTLML